MRWNVEQLQFLESFIQSLKGPLPDLLELKNEAAVSSQLDQGLVQDSFRYRARRLGLKIAALLIDEKGELNRDLLNRLLQLLQEGSFILGPGREGDALIYGHIRNCLQALAQNKEIWIAIHKLSPPLCHKRAEEVIRETLWPESIRAMQTVHVRKGVLAAWLTFLRQATGSCFATAPAILIQQKDPLRFFKDMHDLLSTGQLKRVFAGREIVVPLSLSSGAGDLEKMGIGLENSPGIAVGFEAAGVVFSGLLQEKIRALGPVTIENLFRTLLMEHEGLTEEDIRDEEHLSRIQMTPLLARQSAVYYQKPSERAQKVSNWKKNCVKAATAFKAMTECSLLRTWEYSIASFSDVKTEFARWNLYIGLGLHPEQKNGVGALLYIEINGHLERCNLEIEKLSKEYEEGMGTLQILEEGIRGALSEARRSQLKADWTTYNQSLTLILERRSSLLEKTDSLVKLFSSLIEQYDQKLQEFFQELFDPAIQGEEAQIYDDSSAGFRLVYKHGRLDASQWTPIYTRDQYIECLRDFFSRIERDLESPPHIEKELVSEITTALIQFIQLPEFLNGATSRAKEKGRRSPWDYISGGTLQTLMMAYCNRSRPFTESSIIPHSEEELLQFLSSIKKEGPLLIHSPTHAFLFYPPFLQRGSISKKMANWNEEMQGHIALRLSERLPEEEKALFIHLFRQKHAATTNVQFRNNLVEALGPRIKQKEALVDSILYEHSTLFSGSEAKEALNQIFGGLNRREAIGSLEGTFFSSFDLYQMAKALLLRSMGSPFSSIDWDGKIADVMRRLGYLSQSVLFGDTNWSGWFFGFVSNPATGQLELWRLNRTGTQGFPMVDWKQWLDEKNNSAWVVLTDPKEYENDLLENFRRR